MNRGTRQRRGLSSVIGAVFMIIIMVAALNAMMLSMQDQEKVSQALIEKTDEKLGILNERLEISDVRINDNKFNLTITNSGAIAANLKSIYFVNETSSPPEQYRYDIDYHVDGRNYQTNIGQDLPVAAKDDTAYTIKVVSASGSTVVTQVSPISGSNFPLSLSVIPPTVTPGENVTVLFTVTNNNTATNLASPVGVMITPSIISGCTLDTDCYITLKQSLNNNNTLISKGSTAVFQWVYNVDAPDNTEFMFNATLVNAKLGNFAMQTGEVQLVEAAQTAFQSDIVVTSTLVQKPEIFAMFPSPFGDSSQKGVMGIMVANPTDQPMEVSKIILTVISPRAQSNDKIIDSGGGDDCAVANISPPGTDYWSCPAVNMLMWKKTNPGYTIPGRSTVAFMAQVKPGSLATGSIDLESFSIDTTVFTSMGQFSKSGYSGSMRNSAGALPQVYLSSVANSTSTSDMIGNLTGAKAGTNVTFNAVIADLDTGSSHKINAGSRLIIDVPKCFSDVWIVDSGGFTLLGPDKFSDGSWQIIGTLNTDLTGVNPNAARTIQFKALVDDDIPDPRVYIMYILADGESDGVDAFPVGPIAEIPIQVIP